MVVVHAAVCGARPPGGEGLAGVPRGEAVGVQARRERLAAMPRGDAGAVVARRARAARVQGRHPAAVEQQQGHALPCQ